MTEPTEPSSFFASTESIDPGRDAPAHDEAGPSRPADAPVGGADAPPADGGPGERAAPQPPAAADPAPPTGYVSPIAPDPAPDAGQSRQPTADPVPEPRPDRGPAPGEPGTAGAVLADLGAGREVAGFEVPVETASYQPPATSWSSDRLEAIMRDTVAQQTEEQRRLEQLLADVRSALTAMPTAQEMGGGSEVVAALDQVRAELGFVRESQATAYAQLSARLDALTAPEPGVPSITDVHDGLAGVRTDLTALPELLGPAITSAVAHGVAETNRRVGALHETVQGGAVGHDRALNELSPVLSGLSDQVGALHATVHGTHASTAELAPMLASLSAQVDGLREQVDGASASTQDLAPTLSGLSQRVGALHDAVRQNDVAPQVSGLADQVSALHESVRQNDVAPQVSGLAERVSALHDSVRQGTAGTDELAPALASLHDRVGALHDLAQGSAAQAGDLSPRLVGLSDQVAAVHDAVHGSAAQASDLAPRLSDLAAQVDALRDAVEGSAGTTGALTPMLAGLTDQVGALHETARGGAAELAPRLDALSGELTNQLSAQVSPLHDTLADLNQQMTPLQDALGSLSDRVAALEGRDLGPVLDERLTAHLGAFGSGLGERIDALESQQGAARDDLGALRLAQEGPAGVAPTLLVQLQATEQRLAHHVDEAVLALAQAVLRRRPGATGATSASTTSGRYDAFDTGEDDESAPAPAERAAADTSSSDGWGAVPDPVGGAAGTVAPGVLAAQAAALQDPPDRVGEGSETGLFGDTPLGSAPPAPAAYDTAPHDTAPHDTGPLDAVAPADRSGAAPSDPADSPHPTVDGAGDGLSEAPGGAAEMPGATTGSYADAAYDPPQWGRHAMSSSFDEADDGADDEMVEHLDAWSRADEGASPAGADDVESTGPRDVPASELWTTDVEDEFEDEPHEGADGPDDVGGSTAAPDSLRGGIGAAQERVPKRGLFRRRG